MTHIRLILAFTAATAALVLAAGCGGSTSAADGRSAAAKARQQVQPAARSLYQQMLGANTAWATGLDGTYQHCANSNGANELDYHGIISYLYPFSHSVSLAGYRQQLINAARANGWTFKKYIKGSRDGNMFPDQMEKGPLDGHIAVSASTRSRDYRFSGLIEIESSCFDAGAAAQSLGQQGDAVPLPHPSPAPTADRK